MRGHKGMAALGTILALAIGGGALDAHAALYKWKDKSGRVHYSDKPAPESSSDEQEFDARHSGKEDLNAARAAVEGREARAKAEDEQKKAAQKAAEEKRATEMRARDCSSAKEVLMQLTSGKRLKIIDETGASKILQQDDVAARQAQAQEAVDAACNPPKK